MFIESFFYTTHPILSSEQISELFPQRHPIYPDIKIIYHYGERFYSASAVDALLQHTQQQQQQQQQQQKQTDESATTSVPITTETIETEAIKTTALDSPRSVISESDSVRQRGGSAAAPGSRSIGKRNQQFYLPDGCVKLMHVSVGLENETGGSITDVQNDEGDKWYGRYEKDKNTIVRTSTEYDLPESVDICEYETLAHFAQEHDKECWGNDYIPSNTHNVWKNPHYLFFNTVTLKWEPLSKLR